MLSVVWLLIPMIVMAQRDVVISVRLEETSLYLLHIGFSSLLFTEFHECLSKGADICLADYELSQCPNCIVETVRQSGQINQEPDNFYNCTLNPRVSSLNCHRQIGISTTPGIPPDTYRLGNSSYPSVCFGFVWTFDTEGISFNSNQFDVEFCGADCSCPSRTTPRLTTISTSTSTSPTVSSSKTSLPPATTQVALPSKTSTDLPTGVTTESSPGTDHSSDDTSIGAIVGAVLGVIIIILIIVVIVLMWKKTSKSQITR